MRGDFRDIFLSKIGFLPTKEQDSLIDELRNFVFSRNQVFILNGYAGTGKTTMMSALIKTLPSFNIKCVLLAPTGRAAKVLSLYSHRKAYTIHKRIYYCAHDDSGFIFEMRKNNDKDAIFIVDEASMIGLGSERLFKTNSLLDDLFQYINSGDNCKIIFIGDTAQLPPVGEDISPALDDRYISNILGYNPEGFNLTEVVRQALDSGILINASNLRYRLEKENFSLPIFKEEGLEDVHSISSTDFQEYLRMAYSSVGQDETLVVCRSNKQANMLNNQIRYSILDMENQIEAGDNIMAVKNNYFWLEDDSKIGFIANGDIFKIKRVLGFEEKYGLHFADVIVGFVDYPNQEDVELKIILDTLSLDKASMDLGGEDGLYFKVLADEMKKTKSRNVAKKNTLKNPYYNAVQVKFSYCLTCHKAQGGGWKKVFIYQGFFLEDMLNKEYFRWLYTAVTRAKQEVYFVNFSEEFFKRNK